jgi:hypothetical protein
LSPEIVKKLPAPSGEKVKVMVCSRRLDVEVVTLRPEVPWYTDRKLLLIVKSQVIVVGAGVDPVVIEAQGHSRR